MHAKNITKYDLKLSNVQQFKSKDGSRLLVAKHSVGTDRTKYF